jgi:hypothetical protein
MQSIVVCTSNCYARGHQQRKLRRGDCRPPSFHFRRGKSRQGFVVECHDKQLLLDTPTIRSLRRVLPIIDPNKRDIPVLKTA